MRGDRDKVSSRLAKGVFLFVGVSCISLAFFGLCSNALSLFIILQKGDRFQRPDYPYFNVAFLVMSAICIICELTVFFFGISFVRLKSRAFPFFVSLLVFEVVYVFSIGAFGWGYPDRKISLSIAAATGVANGGLMWQLMTLFVLWAPILVGLARRELHQPEQSSFPKPA